MLLAGNLFTSWFHFLMRPFSTHRNGYYGATGGRRPRKTGKFRKGKSNALTDSVNFYASENNSGSSGQSVSDIFTHDRMNAFSMNEETKNRANYSPRVSSLSRRIWISLLWFFLLTPVCSFFGVIYYTLTYEDWWRMCRIGPLLTANLPPLAWQKSYSCGRNLVVHVHFFVRHTLVKRPLTLEDGTHLLLWKIDKLSAVNSHFSSLFPDFHWLKWKLCIVAKSNIWGS